jgi:hypothetical protein
MPSNVWPAAAETIFDCAETELLAFLRLMACYVRGSISFPLLEGVSFPVGF